MRVQKDLTDEIEIKGERRFFLDDPSCVSGEKLR